MLFHRYGVPGKWQILYYRHKNEGFGGAATYLSYIGEPWFHEGMRALKSWLFGCKNCPYKIQRVENYLRCVLDAR